MHCQVVAISEAVLHAHDLTEHLLLTLALKVPQRSKVFSQHPYRFNLTLADVPCFDMLSFAIIAINETEDIPLLKLGEWLRDSITELVKFGFNKAIEDDADVKVWEEHAICLVVSDFHFG